MLIGMVKNADFRDFFEFGEMIFGFVEAEDVLNSKCLKLRVISEFSECVELCIAVDFEHELGVLLLEE